MYFMFLCRTIMKSPEGVVGPHHTARGGAYMVDSCLVELHGVFFLSFGLFSWKNDVPNILGPFDIQKFVKLKYMQIKIGFPVLES
jgi:hypothetical protein